jgi:hypothetical protein
VPEEAHAMTMRADDPDKWFIDDDVPTERDIPTSTLGPLLALLASIAIFIAIMVSVLIEIQP